MRIVLAVIALFTLTASPAFADWGFARWGDNPGQVIAASGGQVRASTSGTDDDTVEAFPIGAVAPAWLQGGLPFRAVFYFDIDKDALRMVKLTPPRGEALCARLRLWLIGRYGDPQSSSNKAVLRIDQWFATPEGNDMRLSQVGTGEAALCSLVYVPANTLYRPKG
ncbi:hypothetical protein QO010_003821 [Caulobacter ginsengisoli]|uniref:Uncharacterized protein n=1 Tax=Caulobacter ginsengisoli TaxID=400775 RepID=A0ABU0IVI8_9CAUL|nr:hypothetical protein [Caulobacter ginsengisoli]MDQ0466028.1 hypothetical protein [Caulobacter ginsengisoli]